MTTSVLLVGGGMAGAASAYWLARSGARVTLVEREPGPGRHSSGQNAAILRSAIAAEPTRALACETSAFLREPPRDFSEVPLLDPCGLLVLTGDDAGPGPAWAPDLEARGAAEPVSGARLRSLAPHLRPVGTRAWWLAGEGRIDVSALLDAFLRGARRAGADLRYGARVERLLRDGRGRVHGVALAHGERLEADHTVVAAGGWAMDLAASAGLELPLRATRRHLLVSAPDGRIDPRWPVVWDDAAGFYARPESGGMLLCACDQTAVDPDRLEPDEEVLVAALQKAERLLVGLEDLRAAHFWPGLRTLSVDDVPVVGPDPRAPGLAWAAGLGGHGMSISAGLGRALAETLLGRREPGPLGVERLLGEGALHGR